MKDKKFLVLAGLSIVIIGIVFFFITYAISSEVINKKVDLQPLTSEDIVAYDNSIIKSVKPTVDGVKYNNIQELIGVVNEPIVCEVEVEYSISDKVDVFNAYVSFSTDDLVTEPTYTSGDYFQIILPSLNKSVSENNN